MVTLKDGQSAEPGQCGSCRYFRARDYGDGLGLCEFRLPPHVAIRKYEGNERDSEVNERTVPDTFSCSLYEVRKVGGEAVEFSQLRTWQAGNPSR
jgi:hypothetical protein